MMLQYQDIGKSFDQAYAELITRMLDVHYGSPMSLYCSKARSVQIRITGIPRKELSIRVTIGPIQANFHVVPYGASGLSLRYDSYTSQSDETGFDANTVPQPVLDALSNIVILAAKMSPGGGSDISFYAKVSETTQELVFGVKGGYGNKRPLPISQKTLLRGLEFRKNTR